MASLGFNAVLLEISDRLTQDQLSRLKYLCDNEIGKRLMETIDCGTKLFDILRERGKLGDNNTEFLAQILAEIRRDDLLEKLNAFVNGAQHQDDPENAKLGIATEVISEYLGTYWRRFGRKLGLSEVKLDSISRRHPADLYETSVELLKEWRKARGPGACVEDLIKALRACELNLTAHKLESRISDHTHQNS